MTTLERNEIVLRLLLKVREKGAYSTLELDRELRMDIDPRDGAYISRLFYGVLEKSVQLDYIISSLASKKPKPAAYAVLCMGIYMMRYMSEPDYAVVSTQVELMRRVGKGELGAFVNAVLRRSREVKIPASTGDETRDLSINYSCPEWLVKKIVLEYGTEFARDFLAAEIDGRVHIRNNPDKIGRVELAALTGGSPTPTGCYVSPERLAGADRSLYAVQSLASTLAAESYIEGLPAGTRALDLCAAPGGKAVYVAQHLRADVTACDIHPHRVKLIREYAARMGVKLTAIKADATVRNESFVGAFGLVVCDVPCSGVGVYKRKPDILLTRKESDIAAFAATQRAIVDTAADYVAPGGRLCYSTCTILREENEEIVNGFLARRKDFALEGGSSLVPADADGMMRLTPQKNGCDGFFIARLRRTK